jgi:DNA (cytosine-5)-methyltransferase 1
MAIVRHNDVCEVGRHNLPLCDVLVGGFPCQGVSVAGKREGLRDERSGLFFEFVRIASELRAAWLVLENVPGLLSSNEGRDFAIVLLSLEDAGYRCAWRILDSQWFGVAQRRRRVFIVGHSDARRAGAVLFEPEGGAGNTPSMRKAGEDVAHALDARTGGVSGKENQETLVFNWQSGGDVRPGCANKPGSLCAGQTPAAVIPINTQIATRGNKLGRGTGLGIGENGDAGFTITGNHSHAVAYALNAHGGSHGRLDGESESFIAHALTHEGHDASEDGTGRGTPIVGTPTNADRVREVAGLPRGMDSRRYKQLGNAVTVPVIEWLGRRIVEVANAT